jgi:hypothetical protein
MPDQGTPEQQQRKHTLVGNADPRYSEYPLGVLLVRGIITQDQHDAGVRYAGLAVHVLGKSGASGRQMLEHWQVGDSGYVDFEEEDHEAIEQSWRGDCEILMAQGRRAKSAVDNAAYHRLWPVALILRPGLAEFELIDGLQALVKSRDSRK